LFQRPGPGEHPLQFNYAVWFSRKSQGKQTSSTSYDQNLKLVGTFASVSSVVVGESKKGHLNPPHPFNNFSGIDPI
jgi:hypothetical protein